MEFFNNDTNTNKDIEEDVPKKGNDWNHLNIDPNGSWGQVKAQQMSKKGNWNQWTAELEEIEDSEHFERILQKVPLKDKILLNRPWQIIATIAIFATLLPALLLFFFDTKLERPVEDGMSVGTCATQRADRIPCGYQNISEAECDANCCYDPEHSKCYHRNPSRFSFAFFQNWTSSNTLLWPRILREPYSDTAMLQLLSMAIDEVSGSHLSITIFNPATFNERPSERRLAAKDYTWEVKGPELSVNVFSRNNVVFESIHGQLIAANNIWEWSFFLSSDIYGLGSIPLQSQSTKVIYSSNKYESATPLIWYRVNNYFHGLYIESNGPLEISVLESKKVVVKSLTNSYLKVNVLTGPAPLDVTKDLVKYFGMNPSLPYWAFGAHLCSEITSNTNDAATQTMNFISEAAAARLPFDSHCGPQTLSMGDELSESESLLFNAAITALEQNQKKFVGHVSPHIWQEEEVDVLASKSIDGAVFVADPENPTYPYVGIVSDRTVMYPNYGRSNLTTMQSLWPLQIRPHYYSVENIWPLDETPKNFSNIQNILPYFSKELQNSFLEALPYNAVYEHNYVPSIHLHSHKSYIDSFENFINSLSADSDRDKFIFTSALQKMADAYIRSGVTTSWATLKKEMIAATLGGISGYLLWSVPVCGDTSNFDNQAHESLCLKWYLASIYMPITKIHSRTVARDPLHFSGNVKNAMIESIRSRYKLMPYIYSVVSSGEPLLRPMFYNYPEEIFLHDLDEQFSFGRAILIAPNFLPMQQSVRLVLPPGQWYDLWGGNEIISNENRTVLLTSTEVDIITLVNGGNIIPIQEDIQLTAEITRATSVYTLLIALSCKEDNNGCGASTMMKISDEMFWLIAATETNVTISFQGNDFDSFCSPQEQATTLSSSIIKNIRIYGLNDQLNNNENFFLNDRININLCDFTETNFVTINYFIVEV